MKKTKRTWIVNCESTLYGRTNVSGEGTIVLAEGEVKVGDICECRLGSIIYMTSKLEGKGSRRILVDGTTKNKITLVCDLTGKYYLTLTKKDFEVTADATEFINWIQRKKLRK